MHTNNIEKRQIDFFEDEASPNNLLKLLREIRNTQLATSLTQVAQTKAFVLNDIGEPDYDGHRRAHMKMEKAAELVQEYKQDATKRIMGILIVFLLGVFATGLMEYLKMKGGP